jgi:hypothetical protein
MNIYCVVTIDTECDRGLNWRNILPIKYTAVTDLIPNVFEKIFKKHGVKPTYLLSPEVLESKECTNVLKSLSNVELGSHLHGEFVEPMKKPLGEFEGHYQAMYSSEVEALKLANLTRLFEEKIGCKPTSFRAGRWGISPHTFRILDGLGYLVDSSVTPYFNWRFPNYEVNHKTVPDCPYFPENSRLLEVPVTLFSRYGSALNKAMLPGWLKDRLLNVPLWRPKWLRPTYSNDVQMKQVIDANIASHQHEETIVLNMMFHNVEILPDDNPYGFDSKRIASFLDSMDKTFAYLHTLNVKFVGLTDIYSVMKK